MGKPIYAVQYRISECECVGGLEVRCTSPMRKVMGSNPYHEMEAMGKASHSCALGAVAYNAFRSWIWMINEDPRVHDYLQWYLHNLTTTIIVDYNQRM